MRRKLADLVLTVYSTLDDHISLFYLDLQDESEIAVGLPFDLDNDDPAEMGWIMLEWQRKIEPLPEQPRDNNPTPPPEQISDINGALPVTNPLPNDGGWQECFRS